MAQLSRPFQIALLAAAMLAGVLLFTLTRSSSSATGGSTPAVSPAAPATPAATATAKAQGSTSNSATASTHSSHGSGDSLGGLSRAIDKAHHAAAVTQQNSNHLAEKSAQASNETTPVRTSSAATHAPAASATAATPATRSPSKTSTSAPANTSHKSTSSSATAVPSGQRTVEAELAKGDVVVLLFWNPAGADDATVHSAVQTIASAHRQVAVQEATASQVADFGSITRGVQVYATPTILIINKQGKTLVLTGVQDTFSIEQAIAEARSS
jgi:hypothetical protein